MSTAFDPYASPIADIRDVLMVTASAGTGKTWMITHLATRWLLEGDGTPDQLLMVTFSRSAAAELRFRLRGQLRAVGGHLERLSTGTDRGDASSDPWRAWIERLVAERSIDVVRERHAAVVRDLDAVHARTIHSFAALATHRDEAAITDDLDARRAATHEVITRRVTSADPGVIAVIDTLEDDGTKSTPGGAQLATALVHALGTISPVGGLAGGRVSTWAETELPGTEVVMDVLGESSRRLDATLATSGATTFDQLILDLHAEVTSPASPLAARLREQFRFVLIDEFQDTDIIQWEVFDAIFRSGPTPAPVVVVGDPKQAIYGFRGGDVTVIERVRSDIAAGDGPSREVALTVNHRSTGGLLDATNALFSASPDWRFGDDSDIGYVPVSATVEHAGQPGRLLVRTADNAEAAQVDLVDVVTTLLNRHGVAASDLAILGQSRRHVDDSRHALARAGIRTASSGSDSIFDTPAAVHLRVLMWVLSDPTNPRRSRLLAVSWFAALSSPEVAQLAAVIAERGVASASGLILDGLYESLAHDTRSEREVTDVEHLLDVLSARHHGAISPERLHDALVAGARTGDDGGDPDASERRRVESDRDAVRVMTIHAAKGQQFPVVLIPHIESTGPLRRVASWSTATGRALDAGSLLGLAAPTSPYRAREEAGARRLMYVALTRAERLVVAWVPGEKGQWPRLVAPVTEGAVTDPSLCVQAAGSDLDRDGDISALDLATLTPRASAPPRYVGPAPVIDEHLRRWSYSALHVPGVAAAPDDAADADEPGTAVDVAAPIETADVFGSARGATLGSAVHRVMECVVGSVASADRVAVTRHIAESWRTHGLGTPPEDAPTVFARLLTRPLGDLTDGACLDDFVRPGASATEMRFTLPLASGTGGDRVARVAAHVAAADPASPFLDFFSSLADRHDSYEQLWRGYLTGSLDLVLAVGDPARFVIVDYKTNLLGASEGYEPPALYADMARAGYPLQALLYAVALHRFLRGRVGDYDPAHHLGGVGYYYVRGAARPMTAASGLAIWRPVTVAITGASDILDGVDR